ncbi:MAG TPA: DUF1559 domain-containing protein, partial [Lacipirellula sp.]
NCNAEYLDAPCSDQGNGPARTGSHLTSRSHHPGGEGVSLCDASVHFVSDTVELEVWRALSTMAGEEVFPSPF